MAIPRIQPYHLHDACPPIQNKVNWKPEPSRCVLLVHDMQNYFVDFYDRSQSPIVDVIEHCQALIKAFEDNGGSVIYTAQPPNQSAEHRALLNDFWGPGLRETTNNSHLARLPADIIEAFSTTNNNIVTKWRYSAFQRTKLEEWMKNNNRDQIIICGVYAHIGILSTCLEGFMRDIQCFFVEDASADFSVEDHRMARAYIASRCGVVTTKDSILKMFEAKTPTLATTTEHTCSKELHKSIANLLHISTQDFSDQDNLMELGLDSIRLMQLIEQWRSGGLDVDFMDLAENPSVQSWSRLLAAKHRENSEKIYSTDNATAMGGHYAL